MIVEHVGLTVTDLTRSIDFYQAVFGFRLLRKTPISAYLHLDDGLLELIQSEDPRGSSQPDAPEGWLAEMRRHNGLSHIGFRVDNMDEAILTLQQGGGRLVVPPYDYTPAIEFVAVADSDRLRRAAQPLKGLSWRIAVFADPDGIMLEILER
jgi:methylmalonyl-CoA/ethylmalonyl-CoA epimerase